MTAQATVQASPASDAPVRSLYGSLHELTERSGTFGVSLVVHALVLALLWCFHVETGTRAKLVQVTSEIPDLAPTEEFVKLEEVQELNLQADSLTSNSGPQMSESLQNLEMPFKTPAALNTERNLAMLRPLADRSTKFALGENVTGLRGANVDAGGDAGSIDRIVVEILRQLERSKVLVAWVMDASGSLGMRREQIIQRFDKTYQQLDALGKGKDEALLTLVASFGKEMTFETKSPTADRKAILEAVRGIKTDESGVENVFGAVRQVALKWHRMQAKGYRLMIIVLSDECGDDVDQLDPTVQLVQRNKIPVYVLGPMAPFGRKRMEVRWTDPPTGEVFFLPVDRGPESLLIEHANLPLASVRGPQGGIMPSGFGPYALSRLARESGGIYFLYDDGSIQGPKFNVDDLLGYSPDYVSQAEFQKRFGKTPLRQGVLKVAQAANQLDVTLPTRFLAAGIQYKVRDARTQLAKLTDLADKALAELSSLEKYRDEEESKRWRAHYDLLMGRLLIIRLRCASYGQLSEEMFRTPRVPKDAAKNAWELASDGPLASVKDLESPAAEKPEKTSAKATDSKSKKGKAPQGSDADSARIYLTRVVQEHPNTPWAVLAKAELEAGVSYKWQETFMTPPAGEKLPWDKVPWDKLTDTQKEAKKNFEKQQKKQQEQAKSRAEAKTRIPKL